MLAPESYIFVSVVLFTIGAIGVILRKSFIFILMSLEIMLNAINLTLVGVSKFLGEPDGQIIILFVLSVAAAEVAVGLGIAIYLSRIKDSLEVDRFNILSSKK
jgi:NADH-quinone oxidoreductase subunit K